jgi:hypothetical protein
MLRHGTCHLKITHSLDERFYHSSYNHSFHRTFIFKCSRCKRDRYEYKDCLLEHLDHAKLDVASRFIAEACEVNYDSGHLKLYSTMNANTINAC